MTTATPDPLSATLPGEFVAVLTTLTLPVSLPAVTGANCAVTATDWPGVSVTEDVEEVMLKPVPEAATDEIVTLEVPVFVSVALCWPLLPTDTLPKDKLAGLTESSCVEAAPVPESARLSGESVALLTSVIEPAATPEVVGSNTTLNEALFPAAIVSGALMPVMLMPEPETSAWPIVTGPTPALLKVMVWEFEVPVATLPKLTEDGVAFNTRLTPVPDSATVDAEPFELLAIEIEPVLLPAAAGSKLTLNKLL